VSPKAVDPAVRRSLVETAARLLAQDGPRALTTRRLASELGTSTAVVYTHFGSMDGLRAAVREEGFTRLTGFFDTVPKSRDPVADLSSLGWAYCFNGVVNHHLYRAVFLEASIEAGDDVVGRAAVQQAVDTVARCIEAGRFDRADPESLAIQLWAAAHGMVTAVLAHLLTIEEMAEHFGAMGQALFVGFGDDPKRARRSLRRARERMGPTAPTT
jgi:AcrR family transcriptional regulator